MGFFARLLGNEGRVRFSFECFDGRTGTGKCSISTIGVSKEEIEEKLKEAVFVEHGVRVKTLTIIGFVET